jgi:hypothetical protein
MQHEYRLQYVDSKMFTPTVYQSEHAAKCAQKIHNDKVDNPFYQFYTEKVDAVEVSVTVTTTVRAAE